MCSCRTTPTILGAALTVGADAIATVSITTSTTGRRSWGWGRGRGSSGGASANGTAGSALEPSIARRVLVAATIVLALRIAGTECPISELGRRGTDANGTAWSALEPPVTRGVLRAAASISTLRAIRTKGPVAECLKSPVMLVVVLLYSKVN